MYLCKFGAEKTFGSEDRAQKWLNLQFFKDDDLEMRLTLFLTQETTLHATKRQGGSGATFWRRELLFGSHFAGAAFGSCFWEPPLEAAFRSRHNVEAPEAAPREPGAVFGAVFYDYIRCI